MKSSKNLLDESGGHDRIALALALVFSLSLVGLIWWFRFLPLYDYPIWLYNVHVMVHLSDPLLASAYEIVKTPVPNLGLVGLVWILSHVVSIEIAGKIFLSLCVTLFPWSLYYCFKRISAGGVTPLAFLGFPFVLGYFLYSSHAFLFALSISMFVIGYFLPKTRSLRTSELLLLAGCLVLLYFVHAFGFLIVVLVIGGTLIFPFKPRLVGTFLAACVPAFALMIWFVAGEALQSSSESHWSLWSASQSVFKPLIPFVKSFGISNPLPLSLLNLVWILLFLALVVKSILQVIRNKEIDRRFVVPLMISLGLTVLLPHEFVGIVQPGIRFGLLSAILCVLMVHKAAVPRMYSFVALGCSFLVLAYNVFHFSRVDKQMHTLYSAITSSTPLAGKSFATIRLDWPTNIQVWDGFASPFHPLYGAVYYAGLSNGGPAWAFDTALLRLKQPGYEPRFAGRTIDEYASSIISTLTENSAIDVLVLTGRAEPIDLVTAGLVRNGVFQSRAQGAFWRIVAK